MINANGSLGLTPYRICDRTRPIPRESKRPTAMASAVCIAPWRMIRCEDVAAVRAECHSNADLTRPASNRISFDAVNTDDGEQQRDTTKRPEQDRAQLHDPEAGDLLHQIDVGRHLQYRQVWIDLAQRLPERRDKCNYGISIEAVEPNMHVNLAVVTLRQRHKQPASEGVVLDTHADGC